MRKRVVSPGLEIEFGRRDLALERPEKKSSSKHLRFPYYVASEMKLAEERCVFPPVESAKSGELDPPGDGVLPDRAAKEDSAGNP